MKSEKAKNKGSILSLLSAKFHLLPMLVAIDFICFIAAFFLHYFLSRKSGLFGPSPNDDIDLIIVGALMMTGYWMALFWFGGLYKDWYSRSPFDELFTLLQVLFFGSFAIYFFIWADSSGKPRLLIIAYFILLLIFLSIGRIFARRIQKRMRERGIITINALIIGTKPQIIEILDILRKSPAWGYKPTGYLLLEKNQQVNDDIEPNIPFLGYINNLKAVLKNNNLQEVLIATDIQDHNLLMDIVSDCSESKIKIKIQPDLYHIFTGQVRTFPIYGIRLIEINPQLLKPWQIFLKRVIDIIFSALVLIIGMPFWLIIALIIKIDSKGPVFYLQKRAGIFGTEFTIFKYRTMTVGSDKNAPDWTRINDPRVTRFGRFLRKSHLDEIPQFLNVLLGDMSIVGPRPEQAHLVAKFASLIPFYSRRFIVRPGITGWWQVNYEPYVESLEELKNRLKDDFYYIENMSIRLDIEIVLRTIYLVFKGHGQA